MLLIRIKLITILLLSRFKMVQMKTTRKVLRGRRLWPKLDVLMNYKKNSSHAIN